MNFHRQVIDCLDLAKPLKQHLKWVRISNDKLMNSVKIIYENWFINFNKYIIFILIVNNRRN